MCCFATIQQLQLTFLCTSVRMRYSADRSSLAFRLGKTVEFNRSGENLEKKEEQEIKSTIR